MARRNFYVCHYIPFYIFLKKLYFYEYIIVKKSNLKKNVKMPEVVQNALHIP